MSLTKVSVWTVVCLLLISATASATPIPIDIVNPGFDANGPGWTPSPTGWTVSGGDTQAGAFDGVVGDGIIAITAVSPPDFGYLNNGAGLAQVLNLGTIATHAGDQIVISFMQGLRNDQPAYPNEVQDLRVRLWTDAVGTGTLQEVSCGTAPRGDWIARNVTFTLTATDAGKTLYLQMYNANDSTAQIAIDNVSATYTAAPEPNSLLLTLSGLTGLLAYAWRKRR
jgi:hypothetical protein